MAAITIFFGKLFIFIALLMGAKFAWQIFRGSGERTFQETLMLWAEFLLCIVAVAGISDWIGLGQGITPKLASVMKDLFNFALDSASDSVVGKK